MTLPSLSLSFLFLSLSFSLSPTGLTSRALSLSSRRGLLPMVNCRFTVWFTVGVLWLYSWSWMEGLWTWCTGDSMYSESNRSLLKKPVTQVSQLALFNVSALKQCHLVHLSVLCVFFFFFNNLYAVCFFFSYSLWIYYNNKSSCYFPQFLILLFLCCILCFIFKVFLVSNSSTNCFVLCPF